MAKWKNEKMMNWLVDYLDIRMIEKSKKAAAMTRKVVAIMTWKIFEHVCWFWINWNEIDCSDW